MNQLPLPIITKLVYSPDNFLIHSGVRESLSYLTGALSVSNFSCCIVQGTSRSGKSHLSIKLMQLVGAQGLFPRLISGDEIAESSAEVTPGEILIVDDADKFFIGATPGNSGPFVSLYERVRGVQGKLVLLISRSLTEFPCDDHIMSRLRAAHRVELASPSESELGELLRLLAHQRGLKLAERNITFLLKRVGRDLRSLEYYLDRLNHLSQVLGKSIKFRMLADAVG